MNHLVDKHVLVLGLGASGMALARWCVRCGARVTVADTRAAPPQLEALRNTLPQVTFIHSEMSADLFASAAFDMVLKSPGLSPASIAGVIDAAEARGIARGNELSLFSRALADLKQDRGYDPQVIGITGTNGKTTVTSLTGQLVMKSGKSVAVAGNIGPTLLDTLTEKLDQALHAQAQAQADAALAAKDEEQAGIVEGQAMVPVLAPASEVDELPGDQLDDLDGSELPLLMLPSTPDESPPALPELPEMPQVWVLELSSFQLDGVSNFEPTVATVLNVTQDHLDWHGTFPSYVEAKSRIYGHGLMLLNRDDPLVMGALPPITPVTKGKQPLPRPYLTFGSDEPRRPGDYGIEMVNGMAWLVRAALADETVKRRKDEEVVLHIQRLMPMDALRIHGRHNATNALAATALAVAAGCNLAPMLHGLREYRGEPHRVESIAVISDVEYFDDSKGTNVGATVAALQGLGADRKLVVILGGEGKGQDFSPLAEAVSRHARAVVLMGRDAPLIRVALQDTHVKLLDAASLQDAVAVAAHEAHTGDAVLMSPACASFDMFDDYEHRARVFCEAVQALAHDEGVAL
ncbi:MAG: UDP-N-acetylmuramoyl-L-alanine--D-glutamate ligase [Polaromonas sp.]